MKFEPGSEIDTQHCMAIKHEYLRCKDAFERCESLLDELEKGHSRELSYKAYNAYSSYILHLYELTLATQAREFGNTNILGSGRGTVVIHVNGEATQVQRSDAVDRLVHGVAARTLAQFIYREELAGAAGVVNLARLKALGEIPADFAEQFRSMRNKVSGHVTYKRIREIDLSKFYVDYDDYLYLLYLAIGEYWGQRTDEFPDFEQVTNFLSVLGKKKGK